MSKSKQFDRVRRAAREFGLTHVTRADMEHIRAARRQKHAQARVAQLERELAYWTQWGPGHAADAERRLARARAELAGE